MLINLPLPHLIKIFFIIAFFLVLRYNMNMVTTKNEKDFYEKRNLHNLEKIEYLMDELPPFIENYFVGIENQTKKSAS